MKRASLSVPLLCALLSLGAALPQATAQRAQAGPFLDGRWEGWVDFGEGREGLVLRLFSADPELGLPAGGLVDLPARKLFGYPMETLERGPEGLYFSFLGGAPLGGGFELRGSPEELASGESFALSGVARVIPAEGEEGGLPAEAPFFLVYGGALDCFVDTGRGYLPGSLLLPEGDDGEPFPLVLLLSGASADRDGNNYSVPGRSDALADLAEALQRRGLASLRYDRRGTGQAYRLAEREEELRFADHVEDARAALAWLAADPRFSGITILGYGEGALVGSASIAGDALGEAIDRVDGLAALCASGKTDLEMVEEALSSTPEELKPEAEAIMAALRAGDAYPEPSPYFADFFRPSRQPYLSSLFSFDIREAFASAPLRTLVIAGEKDLQVPQSEVELLASAAPEVDYRLIPGMGHALKWVGDDEEANYDSFTEPALSLAEDLVDLVAAFARGEALPGEDPRPPLRASPAD
jgi:uncharacterized protein